MPDHLFLMYTLHSGTGVPSFASVHVPWLRKAGYEAVPLANCTVRVVPLKA